MKYVIQNTSGDFWGGSCWGCREAAMIYTEAEIAEGIGAVETNICEPMDLVDNGNPTDYMWETEDGSESASVHRA